MLDEHIAYLSDGRRTELLRVAISKAVKIGDVVVDLGCGSGILGLLCLQAGAGRVYAIDAGSILEVARETFARAGFQDRVVLLRGITNRLALPEKVDVLVCDHVGYFGFDYGLFRLLEDARRRFLKPGGRIVPAGLTLKMAPVESAEAWAKVNQWRSDVVPPEFHWVHAASTNTKHSATLKRDALLSEPTAAATINLTQNVPEFLRLQHAFRACRGGMLHAISGFFDCQLFGDVRMTNEPGAKGAIDRPQAFLPLLEPAQVATGDIIDVTVTARPDEHLIAWDVNLPGQGLKFRQTTLKGTLMDSSEHRRADPSHRLVLKEEAKARVIVLGYCDGTRSAQEISATVLRDHPGLMPSEAEVTRFVARIVETDTQ